LHLLPLSLVAVTDDENHHGEYAEYEKLEGHCVSPLLTPREWGKHCT